MLHTDINIKVYLILIIHCASPVLKSDLLQRLENPSPDLSPAKFVRLIRLLGGEESTDSARQLLSK
jgi:hypothetical protein